MAHVIWIENHSGTTFWMQMSSRWWKGNISDSLPNIFLEIRKGQCLSYSFIGFFIKSGRPNPRLAGSPSEIAKKLGARVYPSLSIILNYLRYIFTLRVWHIRVLKLYWFISSSKRQQGLILNIERIANVFQCHSFLPIVWTLETEFCNWYILEYECS